MKSIVLSKNNKKLKGVIHLTASKSECNRALIIQALCDEKITINNLAEAHDTEILIEALNSDSNLIDIGHTGTAMRFLTAYYSTVVGERILTGSERMKQRPISLLVDALRKLGAEITYLEKEGFPPLKINGKKLRGGKIEINGNMSSQFISALLMIAPNLSENLEIIISGQLISKPYIQMTISIMRHFGAEIEWDEQRILVSNKKYKGGEIFIEADWSAASYYYEIAALSEEVDLKIVGLKENSLQGDAVVAKIFEQFNITTNYSNNAIELSKLKKTEANELIFNYDFTDCPDLAQTIAATLGGLKMKGKLLGLSSLRIKETDRIAALQIELKKIGIKTEISDYNDLNIVGFESSLLDVSIDTYDDHRMALAFAPLCLIINKLEINKPGVVVKSYPQYWEDLRSIGFSIN